MNLLDIIKVTMPDTKVKVFTTRHQYRDFEYDPSGSAIEIVRCGTSGRSLNLLQRILTYVKFNANTLFHVIRDRPRSVVYFETISAFAPILYKVFINPRSQLMIHFHEYVSKLEYRRGMMLVRILHLMEKRIFPRAVWISQTNQKRVELFRADHAHIASNMQVMPNYPPRSWMQPLQKAVRDNQKIRFVYVGAIDPQHMYLHEFAEFIAGSPNQFEWDIYSNNFDAEFPVILKRLGAQNIHFKGSIPYYDLPRILRGYDIGVVLYKGHLDNFIYNEPNKIFEYYVCGLDVWFPHEMTGAQHLVTQDQFPKICSVNFHQLDNTFPVHLSRDGMSLFQRHYNAESATQHFLKYLFQ